MNEQFITGKWYEHEYSCKWYRHQYIDTQEPEWAKQCNLHAVDFCLMCLGLDSDAKILDIGSGVGRVMRTWQRRGFENVYGLEISQTAVRASGEKKMACGTVADIPYSDGEFDLVFSLALFEHIDETILPQAIKECYRVGKRQAHFIGLEAGTDPSHINIKSIQEWAHTFAEHSRDTAVVMNNPLIGHDPMLLIFPAELGTHPMLTALERGAQ